MEPRAVAIPAITISFVCWLVALFCFFMAVVIAWPVGTIEHGAVLLPLGLFFWCLSTRVP